MPLKKDTNFRSRINDTKITSFLYLHSGTAGWEALKKDTNFRSRINDTKITSFLYLHSGTAGWEAYPPYMPPLPSMRS